MKNDKRLLTSTTKGGHIRYVFCPNKQVADLTIEYIESRGGIVNGIRNFTDTGFLQAKIKVRTYELEEAIKTYHMVLEEDIKYTLKETLIDTLLTSIEGHISSLFGLIRRAETKGYNIDLTHTKSVVDKWLGEEEY